MSAPPASATGIIPVGATSRFLSELPWVAVGGALGAASRGGVATLLAGTGGGGLAATQLVNGVGAFALGFLIAVLDATGPRPRLRAFVGVGLLGSFTTYSTLIAEARDVAVSQSYGVALAFLGGSVALGCAAFVSGHALARRLRLGEVLTTGTRESSS